MPELLIELLSEEIPARMQARASEDLKRLVMEALGGAGLKCSDALAMATPRRLALVVRDVPAASAAVSEERKGPRIGAPKPAIDGFLKGAGLASIEAATIVRDEKKGDYYVARIERPGRPAADILTEILPVAFGKLPWPKSMRWGRADTTWVRPLTSIVCLLGGAVVPLTFAGIASGRTTFGHRFHGGGPIEVKGFEDYANRLKDARVLLLASERALMIREQAADIAKAARLELVEDEGLLAENAGLTEWPLVLKGSFDETFLEVPAECLTGAMRKHQKCFSLRKPRTGALANAFLLVSNLTPADGGAAIIAGNEKVIRARLSDARFFWQQDLKRPLDEMAAELAGITFHERLGTQKDRVERLQELAFCLAGAVDATPEDARRAAQLAKADLVSGMVGEFPELQGFMGRRYAEAAGTKPEIARAVELHYKPKGPTDTVPLVAEGNAVAVAVALADKIDTLSGFWLIGEKPTGSGDPYQLRRAALGIIRIVLENDLRLPLRRRFEDALRLHLGTAQRPAGGDIAGDLVSFLSDRLKVHLREEGVRHDIVDAVLSEGALDDLALVVKRIRAVEALLATDDGANLLAGVKRAANILAIEEKKEKRKFDQPSDAAALAEAQEKALHEAITKVRRDTSKAIDVENFSGAMRALAELRGPIDAFFDKVTVNAPDTRLRENRLRMLSEIRSATRGIADLTRISG